MSFQPDAGASPIGITFTRSLSQRDLAIRIPVNYVTVAAVALTPACFGTKRYEDASAAKCMSNLMAMGFHRFEIDLYWDSTRHVWSLCPVELGNITTATNTTTGAPSTISTLNPSTTNATTGVTARNIDFLNAFEFHQPWERQASSDTGAVTDGPTETSLSGATLGGQLSQSTAVSPSEASTTTSSTQGGTSTTTPSAGKVIKAGPYECTTSLNFISLTEIMAAALESTETDLNATLKYWLLNLHVASSVSRIDASPSQPHSDDLPNENTLLSSIMSTNLSKYLYTPDELDAQRANLNGSDSWYGGYPLREPDSAYFQVVGSKGRTSTPNGWPSESFVEMEYGKRLLVGYGQVDPQLGNYNFSGDASTIFKQGQLQSPATITANSNGQVSSGCFFQPLDQSLTAANNNSWALYGEITTPQTTIFSETTSLTNCGITPLLNETLNNTSADQNYTLYQNYIQSTIWSWAPGEPRNKTNPDSYSGAQYRCAALNASSGFWVTEDCNVQHYSACRHSDEPYKWSISSGQSSYIRAGISCARNTAFSVPRTALENRYLHYTWQQSLGSLDADDGLLWLNFNDLDAATCWVVGQNTTCPYIHRQSGNRTVIVPTVAGVIVFVVAILTVFVKCAANRRKTKRRRRRVDDGWDYEGVPS